MEAHQLQNIAFELFDTHIDILKQTQGGRWFECEYTKDFKGVNINTVYGVSIDNTIIFDFKVGKNEDSIIKSFINQFISKYESKRIVLIDGEIRNQTVKEVKTKIKNDNRVSKYFFYTTLYGIGYFCLFNNAKTIAEIHKTVGKYLVSKNVKFRTEFSDAGWVYRFVINAKIDIHNKLLTNFEL